MDSYPPWVPCHHEERGHWTSLVLCLHTPPSWVFMCRMCVLALLALAFCIALLLLLLLLFAVYVASTNSHNKEPQNNNHDKLVPHYTVRSVTFIHSLDIEPLVCAQTIVCLSFSGSLSYMKYPHLVQCVPSPLANINQTYACCPCCIECISVSATPMPKMIPGPSTKQNYGPACKTPHPTLI